MITSLMTYTGWLFWIVIAILIVVEVCLYTADYNDDDRNSSITARTCVFVGGFAAFVFFSDAFHGVSPWWILVGCVAYVVAGVLWAIKSWYSYLVEARDDLRKRYDNAKPNITETWNAYIVGKIPTAANNKQRIVSWMVFWPFSMLWWVLSWPRRVFTMLYNKLSKMFDFISNKVFSQ